MPRKTPMARLMRNLCPAAYAAHFKGSPPEIANMPANELLEAYLAGCAAQGMTREEALTELSVTSPDCVDSLLALITALEIKLATGEVDRWIAEHSGAGLTRAHVEEHLAFLRGTLPPPTRQ
jgi:hypothetical protein